MSELGTVRGWAAAAAVAGRSVAGVRKLVATGRLRAMRVDGTYVFGRADLEALPPVQGGAGEIEGVQAGQGGAGSSGQVEESAKLLPMAGESAKEEDADAGAGDPVQAEAMSVQGEGAPVEAEMGQPGTVVVHAQVHAVDDADREDGRDGDDGSSADAGDDQVQLGGAPEAVQAVSVVENVHEAEMQALDVAVAELRAELVAAVAAIEARFAGEVQALARRIVVLERRLATDRTTSVAALSARVSALEAVVRALPAAPLLIDRRCGCGGPLVVMAACAGCGAGRARAG